MINCFQAEYQISFFCIHFAATKLRVETWRKEFLLFVSRAASYSKSPKISGMLFYTQIIIIHYKNTFSMGSLINQYHSLPW